MRPAVVIASLAVATSAAGADELRAARKRASSDLRCRKVMVDNVIEQGTEVIVAEGCGRSASYREDGGELVLLSLELEPTPAMEVRAQRELDCPAPAISMTRVWVPATRAHTLEAYGCNRRATYDVEGEALELVSLAEPASDEVAHKVAADLGCAARELKVRQIRDKQGTRAATNHCQTNAVYEYRLEPFERVVQPRSQGMNDVLRRAAADMGCPLERLDALWEGKQTKDQDPVKVTITGCGQTAIYERKPYGYVSVTSAKRETP